VHLILQALGESSVPKAVLKSSGKCESIQKSLWILCKKITFSTTSALQIDLRMMKFPLIILVKGTHACYHHIVVTWRGMIIDYGSKYKFPFTNDSLRQISGVNATFDGISCGYGIFPPTYIDRNCDVLPLSLDDLLN
jgi:hypothetical protein